jgi:peptide/nickel transport system substrate-binding protein
MTKRFLALLATVTLLATACSFDKAGNQGTSQQTDKQFDIAVGIEPDTFDPAGGTTTTVANMVDYSLETLTRLDSDGKLQPGLATSWELGTDGLTATLKLRTGVKFHDGTPFNALAVKFTLDRVLDPAVTVPTRSAFKPISKVDAVDDSTVRITLSRPYPPLFDALSTTAAAIVSPASVDKQGNTYKKIEHPIGTGPYTFDSYKKGDRVIFQRYAEYWGEKPYYSTVVFRIVPEAAARESLLLAGQADMIILPPISDVQRLDTGKTKVLLAPSDRSIFIQIKTPRITDVRVRQAFNYAVDKQAMIKTLLFGAAEALDAPMSNKLNGYCRTGSYDYDPAKAKSLLQQAGVTSLTVTMGTPKGRYLQDAEVAESIVNYLREVGVTANLETMDWSSYISQTTAPLEKQKFDVHLLGWAPQFLDASFQMQQFESSNHPPAGLASSFYRNPEVDSLVKQASLEVDKAKRDKLYCDASKIIWEDAPWIFLWTQKFPIVYSRSVENISSLPVEKFSAIYARPVGKK